MVKHKIEFILTRIIGFIAKSIPLGMAYVIGDTLGNLFFYVLRIRRKVAFENLKTAFGNEKSEQEINEILRKNYCHFGRVLIEFARFPLMKRENIAHKISIKNKELLDNEIAKNKGVLVLTGHFGNWEYLAGTLANIGHDIYCVFMEQKNKAVDELIKKTRIAIGMRPLKIGGGAAKGVFTALKSKSMVLIVMDQDAGKDGEFIDFFRKPAATSPGPAAIAIRYKIPAVMAFGIRGSDGKISIEFVEFPNDKGYTNDRNGIRDWVIEYNQILENYIRKYPEQWFWMHRRWKTPPPKN